MLKADEIASIAVVTGIYLKENVNWVGSNKVSFLEIAIMTGILLGSLEAFMNTLQYSSLVLKCILGLVYVWFSW